MIRFKILILFLSLFLFTNVNADVVKKLLSMVMKGFQKIL